MAKEQTFSDMVKYSEKLAQLVKPSEYGLPISVHYLDNGAVLVTIFKGMKTITRALFEDGILAGGSSKCASTDVYSRKVGQEISKARTYQDWAIKKEELWISRAKPVPEPELRFWNDGDYKSYDYKLAFGKVAEAFKKASNRSMPPKYQIDYQK
jgi:hypothetical protein